MEMLAAQAHHREDGGSAEDEDAIAADQELTIEEKKATLQKSLNMAASNGDVKRVRRLVGGSAKDFVDVNAPDDEGTVPLIYASCFVRHGEPCGRALRHTDPWNRGTKTWFQHYWTQELKSISRTAISGVH